MKLTQEMMEKARAAKTAEELLEIAKANGVEMTEDEAKTYFAQLNPKSGELDEDLFVNVSGGWLIMAESAKNEEKEQKSGCK